MSPDSNPYVKKKKERDSQEEERQLEAELSQLNQRLFHNFSSLAIKHDVKIDSPRKGGVKKKRPVGGPVSAIPAPARIGPALSVSHKQKRVLPEARRDGRASGPPLLENGQGAVRRAKERAQDVSKNQEAVRRRKEDRAIASIDKRANLQMQKFGSPNANPRGGFVERDPFDDPRRRGGRRNQEDDDYYGVAGDVW